MNNGGKYMGKNVEGLVNEYLGDLVKFDIGVANNKLEIKVIYNDDYDLRSEYSFMFDKGSKETSFGGNISRSRFGKYKFDRVEQFETELVQQFTGGN
jgi:hypothetical protein